ncbi:potassium channel family protein [Reichenbachiella ulvae]|uniref:TrkA family potassium uptake protein n=1 Tax=Reichenbachiella ulvae TaxID=2980104 RepID=A0ABT3CV73_9BACT|nr:TrkA family potassium uptake protein [Reichenbachiella ulvae]MCV9387605.1 TrkA family potassium uptake protein [Reichenbachiella ulvae]
MKYIIVGLGNFGSSLALKLAEGGHDVIGVDNNENHINEHKDKLTHTLKMDSAHELAVSQLPLSDTDAIIICIGEDSGAAITTVALFKKHAPNCRIVARYTTEIQKTILEAMGIEELVNPEAEFADNFANRLTITGSLNTYMLDDKYELVEFELPESYIGKTVQEVDIVKKWKVSLITLIRHTKSKNLLGREIDKTEVQGVISGTTEFNKGDTLMLFGKIKDLKNMMDHYQED